MPAGARQAARRFSCERMARSLHSWVSLQPLQQFTGSVPFLGQHLTHYPVHLGPGDPGHLFPPFLLQTQQESPAQQAQSDMVIPAGPSTRLVFVQPHIALFGLKFGFNAPSRPAHVSQCVQGSVLRGVGQVVAGFATVQIPPEYGPELLAGLPPPGYPDPLGAEHIGSRSLGTLRHRYLPPGSFRQFSATLHHGPALPVHQPGLAGTPKSLIVRVAPGRLQRPDRHVRPHVQHVPHSCCRQTVPEGRRHAECGIPGDPPGTEMAPCLRLGQHLQGQLHPFGRLRTGLVRYSRRSAGTPAAAHRSASEVHSSGRYKRLSASARPPGPT